MQSHPIPLEIDSAGPTLNDQRRRSASSATINARRITHAHAREGTVSPTWLYLRGNRVDKLSTRSTRKVCDLNKTADKLTIASDVMAKLAITSYASANVANTFKANAPMAMDNLSAASNRRNFAPISSLDCPSSFFVGMIKLIVKHRQFGCITHGEFCFPYPEHENGRTIRIPIVVDLHVLPVQQKTIVRQLSQFLTLKRMSLRDQGQDVLNHELGEIEFFEGVRLFKCGDDLGIHRTVVELCCALYALAQRFRQPKFNLGIFSSHSL